ncbi:MAG: ABC transporter ATP-binding protein [Syntrophomonadaceae bacterium]|nr:ABC transporter ATP-binding protein [Syntrophomonadaceae bacterium]
MVIDNLCFSYGDNQVLKNVSFSAEHGQFLSVLGPNGVGKSTLFRCMLGLLKPDKGGASIDGQDIAAMTSAQLARRIAYIPQSHNPVFNFSVFDMVLMGMTAQIGSFESPRKKHLALANAALERLGIAHLKHRGYGNTSGGERQLILIARAIAQQARILIMDEPSASLDFGNRIRVMQTVRELAQDGYAIIQSTHDPDQAFLYSDRILALYDGNVLAWGTPEETVCNSLISTLYNADIEVCSLRGDGIRVCVPANIDEIKK